MRLVFLCGGSPHPEGKGLSYQWITTRAKGYQKKGHEVFILAPFTSDLPEHYRLEEINFYRLNPEKAFNFLKDLNPDRLLIHHFSPWTTESSYRFQGKKIFWIYGPEISSFFSYYEKPGKITHFFLRILESLQNRKLKSYFSSTSSFVCTSRYAAQLLFRVMPDLNPVIVRDPIEIPEADFRGKNSEDLVKGLAVEVLDHRFLIPSGIDLLIKSFSSASGAALTLLGGGNAVSDLKKWIERENSSIQLVVSEVSEKNLSDWFQSHHYFLTASRMERFVFRACLAMSYGVPVIAPDRWAFSEIIQNGRTGFVFNPDNPVSFLHGIQAMTKNYKIFGTNSRKWVEENCKAERIIDQELSLIQKD